MADTIFQEWPYGSSKISLPGRHFLEEYDTFVAL